MNGKRHELNFGKLVGSIREVDDQLTVQAGRAVNLSLTLRNWLIGCYIAEYELCGSDRATYGDSLLTELAKRLVDLKLADFSHENIGQLNTYVSWYRKNMMMEGDNPPVGILLCTGKDHALVEYALAGMDNHLFVSKYLLAMPKKEEMQRFLEEQIRII